MRDASELTKQQRREAMPISAEFIDAMVAEFGKPASINAEENGWRISWSNERRKECTKGSLER